MQKITTTIKEVIFQSGKERVLFHVTLYSKQHKSMQSANKSMQSIAEQLLF